MQGMRGSIPRSAGITNQNAPSATSENQGRTETSWSSADDNDIVSVHPLRMRLESHKSVDRIGHISHIGPMRPIRLSSFETEIVDVSLEAATR